MTTITRHSYKLSLKRATKRITRRRRRHPHNQKRTTTTTTIDPFFKPKCNNKKNNHLCQKLEALKNLIPTTTTSDDDDGEQQQQQVVKPDQLFKETADYIVLLRTRVFVLQKLIEYYGNNSNTTMSESEEDGVLLS